MPKVSVLMPAHNASTYLGESIQSILNQNFKDFEFVIVDDASTDGTWSILEQYAATDDRIKIVRNQENLGIAATRNRLLGLATGEYIAWQDADDISQPWRLNKQVSVLDQNPHIGICGGYLEFFNKNKVLGVRRYAATDKMLRQNIFRFSPVAQPVAMIRREAINRAGHFESGIDVAEDLLMSFKIGQWYQFANVPEVLLRYRQQSNSITFKKLKTLELNTLKIRNEFRTNPAYQFRFADAAYNLLQLVTLYLSPVSLRIWLFNTLRNSKR
ncbi:MAG: glycosyltransferase family 2 protein [Candidatus Buchananbacteria bacterium]|nr:glycosyltransferase family 2 protein [Candidatus Buchananbacteria bacterium]